MDKVIDTDCSNLDQIRRLTDKLSKFGFDKSSIQKKEKAIDTILEKIVSHSKQMTKNQIVETLKKIVEI